MLPEKRLVVVSNRLPWTLRRDHGGWRASPSAGGLVTALGPVVKATGGIWIGWPGTSPRLPNGAWSQILEQWEREHGYVAVDLPRATAEHFYQGYANRTLWPLFHQFPSRMEFAPEGWEAYVEANGRFCDVVCSRLRTGDTVWVHDYHLMLLPRLLRERAPETPVGFFLHIPFPSSETFRILPRQEELLRGVLGADLIAFQTHRHMQHFRSSLLRILGIESRMDEVLVEGRFAQLRALPIGIVPEEFTVPLERDQAVTKALGELHRRYEGRRLLLAVDRLDYTKGIPERLRTFRRLLERAPRLRGQVVLIQVAVPSREEIGLYAELGHQVNELVGEINGSFGSPDWTPVVFIRRPIPRAELVALYTAADVGWVTPLRDGMNLVAKEYVACQHGGVGALLLSEFAGAAAEMGEAFLVNPYDEDRTAAVLETALSLPARQRRERMWALHRRVLRNTAQSWSQRFLADLELAASGRRTEVGEIPSPLPVDTTVAAFRRATSRLLLLGYDGTLVPFASRPQEAIPPPELVALIGRLCSLANLRVALVTGRPGDALEDWFGAVEALWIAAEHGAILRTPHSRSWEPLRPDMPAEWKARVLPVLEHYVDRAPGSFVEEKAFSLVFHHRMADPEFGGWLANDLLSTLEELLAETDLHAVRGPKSVEVRLTWANKLEVLHRLAADLPRPDFWLALGNDRSDEDLFERLPSKAWTVHVGDEPSLARFSLKDPEAVRHLLEALADSEEGLTPEPAAQVSTQR